MGGAAQARPRERGRALGIVAVRSAPWRPHGRTARLRLDGAGACGGAAGRARPDALALREALLALDTRDEGDLTTGRRDTLPRAVNALVERGRELESLHACVSAAWETGRGSSGTDLGDAGVGKSALVRTLIDGLASDLTVHVGGCDDLVAPRSLGPFQDMAAEPNAPDSSVSTILEAGTMPECSHSLAFSDADRPSRWSRTCTGRMTRPSTQ